MMKDWVYYGFDMRKENDKPIFKTGYWQVNMEFGKVGP